MEGKGINIINQKPNTSSVNSLNNTIETCSYILENIIRINQNQRKIYYKFKFY